MSAKANPKLIGGFVVGGFALAILGLVTFGTVQFFATRIPIVMYFTGDLTGLDIGAPVNFRGVRVGTVTNVVMRFNMEERSISIPVFAEIETERFDLIGTIKQWRAGQNMPALVERGLRAQLASQSLVTGKLLVELDLHPGTVVKLVGADTGYAEVPTIPSQMAELQASLHGLLDTFSKLPLPQLLDDVRSLVQNTDKTVRDIRVEQLVAIGEQTLREYGNLAVGLQARTASVTDEATQVLRSVDQQVGEVARGVKAATTAGEAALKRADSTLVSVQAILADARPAIIGLQRTIANAELLLSNANSAIEPGSPIYRELVIALREISGTARSIRALADELERNPNSVLFGKASARPR
jgi:paraquat-inducible protein B